jgi:hypothetical protein
VAELNRLGKDLHDKTYEPQPVRRKTIPKPGEADFGTDLGSLLWSADTGGGIESSPAVANGVVSPFAPPSRPDPAALRPDVTLQPHP